MLSLLFYAKSSDIVVPDRVIHELYSVILALKRANERQKPSYEGLIVILARRTSD